jgi:hypothetical protein
MQLKARNNQSSKQKTLNCSVFHSHLFISLSHIFFLPCERYLSHSSSLYLSFFLSFSLCVSLSLFLSVSVLHTYLHTNTRSHRTHAHIHTHAHTQTEHPHQRAAAPESRKEYFPAQCRFVRTLTKYT